MSDPRPTSDRHRGGVYMRSFKNSRADRDASDARRQLAAEFPRLSAQVIDTMIDAYRTVTPNVPAAVRAARVRILDACAT